MPFICDGKTYNTTEELMADWELERKNDPWHKKLEFYFSCKIGRLKDFWFDFRMAWQRLVLGYSDNEVWGFNDAATKWMLPRLVAFRNLPPVGHPGVISYEEWLGILDKIILGLQTYAKYHLPEHQTEEELPKFGSAQMQEDERIIDEGLSLLAKWWHHLWD